MKAAPVFGISGARRVHFLISQLTPDRYVYGAFDQLANESFIDCFESIGNSSWMEEC